MARAPKIKNVKINLRCPHKTYIHCNHVKKLPVPKPTVAASVWTASTRGLVGSGACPDSGAWRDGLNH